MKEQVIFGVDEITISLTNKNSHKVKIDPGQGSFSIGTKDISKGQFDAWVEEKDIINWNTFDGFYTLESWKHKDNCLNGDWPRFFEYSGNDKGFIEWSKKREIEDFTWIIQKDMVADFSNANISKLYLYENNNKFELSLGTSTYYLDLHGNLENYKINKCEKIPRISFYPTYDKNLPLYKLPKYENLKNASEIHIFVSPNDPPFDCTSLLQFANLKELFLIGNMTNLDALKDLKNLSHLRLYDMPNLSNMPKLSTWPNLNEFVAVNIEENAGKLLRKELNKIKKVKVMKFTAISKLRPNLWFKTNYGIPFSNWEKNEKKAMSAYKSCLSIVKKAKTEEDIKRAIIDFTEKINKIEDIETTERDDTYIALCNIMDNSPIEIDSKRWELWFDETREF